MAEALHPMTMPPRITGGRLAAFPPLTLFLFVAPVAAGLAGVVLPAFGFFPALGGDRFTLAPWRDLLAAPGLSLSLGLTLASGFGATILALALAMVITAAWSGTRAFARLRQVLAPLLAVPHAAFAIGFAFLAAPSGWIARLLSPWATGWQRPPDLALVQDPNGLALMLALVCKEVFFLLLMILAALSRVHSERLLIAARAMGYGHVTAWCKIVWPLVYGQIRLPVYAVLAYGLSVVDMAMILGPDNPPTLAVLIMRWSAAPTLDLRFQAAAGALLLLALVAAAIVLWRFGEHAAARLARPWLRAGRRHMADGAVRAVSGGILGFVLAVTAGAMALIVIWSLTGVWRFPDSWPEELSLETWREAWPVLAGPFRTMTLVAVTATAIALVVVVGCLENEQYGARSPTQKSLMVLYVPLVIPQVSFLFGLQILLVAVNLDGSMIALVWSHLVFVVPYLFLVLSGPYRALDPRFGQIARAMGASPARVFWRIRLPLLTRAILTAAAVGLAVSVSQYLATIFAGAGRLPTITTEAVALASGGDRRLTAVYGLVQMALPLAGFALALMVPLWQSRNRRGLKI